MNPRIADLLFETWLKVDSSRFFPAGGVQGLRLVVRPFQSVLGGSICLEMNIDKFKIIVKNTFFVTINHERCLSWQCRKHPAVYLLIIPLSITPCIFCRRWKNAWMRILRAILFVEKE